MKAIDDSSQRLARLRDRVLSGGTVAEEDVVFLGECLGRVRKIEQRAAAEYLAVLARKNPRAETALQAALESVDARTRWGAAYSLSLLGEFPPAAIDIAIDLLRADDRDLRWAAADLIRRAASGGQRTAAKRLCETAKTGDLLQRRMALYALRDLAMPDATALEAARDALVEQDVELRLAGLSALVQLSAGYPDTADRLIDLLDDPEPRLRRAAAAALGSVGSSSPKVRRAIERALTSTDESVRRAAKRSLDRLGSC